MKFPSKDRIYYLFLSIVFFFFSPLRSVMWGFILVFFLGYALEFEKYAVGIPMVAIAFFAFGVYANKEKKRLEEKLKETPDTILPPPLSNAVDEVVQHINFEATKQIRNTKKELLEFAKFYFYVLVGLSFTVIGTIGYFADVPPVKVALAEKELIPLKAKQCKLHDHIRVYSKYRVRPMLANNLDRQDAVEYITDEISKSRVRNGKMKRVEYHCVNGEKIRSVYRYKELWVKLK